MPTKSGGSSAFLDGFGRCADTNTRYAIMNRVIAGGSFVPIRVALLNQGHTDYDGGLGYWIQWGRRTDDNTHHHIGWARRGSDRTLQFNTTAGTTASAIPGRTTSGSIMRNVSVIQYNANTGQVTSVAHQNLFIPSGSNFESWSLGTVSNMWGNHTTAASQQTRNNAPLGVTGTARNWSFPAHSPCPPGWRVPSRWEWGDMLGGSANTNGFYFTGTAGQTLGTVNQWQWRESDPINNTARGVGGRIMTRTDSQAQVFLPAGSRRSRHDGAIDSTQNGHFWSSTPSNPASASAWRVTITRTSIQAGSNSSGQSWGLAVRCIR